MRLVIVAIVAAACSGSDRTQVTPTRHPEDAALPRDVGPGAEASSASPGPPITLDGLLDELRAAGLAEAAEVIARRTAQPAPKMRLPDASAFATARALVTLAKRPAVCSLHAVMPRSTVELVRASVERDVGLDELDRIATYLVRVATVLDFERAGVFDENHSHVTGRDWPEIDYSGEGMTWQGQRAYWRPRGVESFKRAAFIHAYFIGAERLPHWKRVYRPRGKMADVTPP
jgi:hypothetical protein